MRRYQTRRKVVKQSLLGPRNWSRNSAHHYVFQFQSRERNSSISQVLVNRTERRATYLAYGQTEFKKLPFQSRMSKEKKQQLGMYKKYCRTKERKHWKNLRKNTVQYLFNCRNQKKKYPCYSKKYIYDNSVVYMDKSSYLNRDQYSNIKISKGNKGWLNIGKLANAGYFQRHRQ